jgi:hypothetical protein
MVEPTGKPVGGGFRHDGGHGKGSGATGRQRRPWAHSREGADGFIGGSRGVGGIFTAIRRCLGRRARRAEQRADRWTKGGAAGRHVREQHVVCADFKGLGKADGALGRRAWGADAEAGAAHDVAARHVVVDGEILST